MAFASCKYKWLLIVTVSIFVGLFSLMIPAGNRLSETQVRQAKSVVQLRGLSKLVLNYKNSHGGVAPSSLCDLTPEDRILLRESTNYALPLTPNTNILAFEISGLWQDGSVAVCFHDLSVKRIKGKDLKALLDADKGNLGSKKRDR